MYFDGRSHGGGIVRSCGGGGNIPGEHHAYRCPEDGSTVCHEGVSDRMCSRGSPYGDMVMPPNLDVGALF
jgi:hypothetical protein